MIRCAEDDHPLGEVVELQLTPSATATVTATSLQLRADIKVGLDPLVASTTTKESGGAQIDELPVDPCAGGLIDDFGLTMEDLVNEVESLALGLAVLCLIPACSRGGGG